MPTNCSYTNFLFSLLFSQTPRSPEITSLLDTTCLPRVRTAFLRVPAGVLSREAPTAQVGTDGTLLSQLLACESGHRLWEKCTRGTQGQTAERTAITAQCHMAPAEISSDSTSWGVWANVTTCGQFLQANSPEGKLLSF